MIGILDSGIGGLRVLQEFMQLLPDYDYIYFGDTVSAPYGDKSSETIVKRSLAGARFLVDKGSEIIVIAGDSISCVAYENISASIDKQVFEKVTPAAEAAVDRSEHLRIGVIGEWATIESGQYEERIKKINGKAVVFSCACPLLSSLLDNGWRNKPETRMIVKKYLHPLKTRQIDTLIFACSKYTVLSKIIQSKVPNKTLLVDPATETAEYVKRYLSGNTVVDKQLGKNKRVDVYLSDVTDNIRRMAKIYFSGNIRLNKVIF